VVNASLELGWCSGVYSFCLSFCICAAVVVGVWVKQGNTNLNNDVSGWFYVIASFNLYVSVIITFLPLTIPSAHYYRGCSELAVVPRLLQD
jgi:hypothetical protein